jgi:hypothetical protein
MDPFYLGIPSGPAIPPVEHTGLQRIDRRDSQQQTPQQQEQDEQDEFQDEDLDQDLEPLETYDDHGRLHELGPGVHQLDAGDNGLPESAGDGTLALPVGSDESAHAPEREVAEGGRRRSDDPGHIDISA